MGIDQSREEVLSTAVQDLCAPLPGQPFHRGALPHRCDRPAFVQNAPVGPDVILVIHRYNMDMQIGFFHLFSHLPRYTRFPSA